MPARVAIICPEECRCDTGGYFVYCDGASLNPAPLIHLTAVQVLYLRQHKIPLLEKDSFVSLTELERLHIGICGLRTIELGALNGLTELTMLTVWSDEVREITPGTFWNVNSLECLD